MTPDELRTHMTAMHYGYDDTGRVVSVDDYRAIIHDDDHTKGSDGVNVPHTHPLPNDRGSLMDALMVGIFGRNL